ncbi:MAG: TIGR04086 family membrane protein [Clostridia bacterium]|nr:TIGR04086 family membrane protein [Clostridia bacterium]
MNKESNYNFAERLVVCALATLLGALVITAAMLLSAALMLYFDLSEGFASPISGVCMGIGTFVSGLVAARKIKTGGIVNGSICGIMIYLLIFVISMIISPSAPTLISLYHGIIALLSSAIGGMIGVNLSSSKKLI